MEIKFGDIVKAAMNEPKAPEDLVKKTIEMAKSMEKERTMQKTAANSGPSI